MQPMRRTHMLALSLLRLSTRPAAGPTVGPGGGGRLLGGWRGRRANGARSRYAVTLRLLIVTRRHVARGPCVPVLPNVSPSCCYRLRYRLRQWQVQALGCSILNVPSAHHPPGPNQPNRPQSPLRSSPSLPLPLFGIHESAIHDSNSKRKHKH